MMACTFLLSHNQALLSILYGIDMVLEGLRQKLFWVYSRTAVITATYENENFSLIYKRIFNNNLTVPCLAFSN